jgi:hypothetical protein
VRQASEASGYRSLGIEDMGLAEGERDGVEFARAFVEEVAEVGGGSVGGGDGEVHGGWCDCSGSFGGKRNGELGRRRRGFRFVDASKKKEGHGVPCPYGS